MNNPSSTATLIVDCSLQSASSSSTPISLPGSSSSIIADNINTNKDDNNDFNNDRISTIFSMSPAILMFASSQQQQIHENNNHTNDINQISLSDNNNFDLLMNSDDLNKKYSFSSMTSVSDSGTESIIDGDFANDKLSNHFHHDFSKITRSLRKKYLKHEIMDHSTPIKAGNNWHNNDDDEDDKICDELNLYNDSDDDSETTLSNCQSPPSSYLSSPVNDDEFDGTPKSNDTICYLNSVCDVLKKELAEQNQNKDCEKTEIDPVDHEVAEITLENIDKVILDNDDNNQNTDSDNNIDENDHQHDSLNELSSCDDIEEIPDNDRRNSTLVRSTSLKTGKTPPGTPGEKKIVRFADALGLDLASIRHIVDHEDYLPPLSAFKSLQLDDEDRDWLLHNRSTNRTSFIQNNNNTKINVPNELQAAMRMLFDQPTFDPIRFMERVRTNKVSLENCLVNGPKGSNSVFEIKCIIRVLNICFHKQVILRYTTNEWLTWTEIPGTYLPNSNDGFSDKFMINFEIAVNSHGHQTMMPGQRLIFAIRYIADNEYWDNNFGMNYSFIYQRS